MPFKRSSKEQRKDYLELSEYVGDINMKKYTHLFIKLFQHITLV